jgi:AbrB family looped-hinge helix DNA binding protein
MSRTIAEEVTFGDRGRVVLPSSVRSELGWTPGTRLLVTTESDGSLRMRPYRVVAEALRGILADVAPGESLVDELIAERRAEAARED